MDQCEYLRNAYGVPAHIGGHVRVEGRPGVIKGATHHLKVLFAGDKKPKFCHPTWRITYLNNDGTIAHEYGD